MTIEGAFSPSEESEGDEEQGDERQQVVEVPRCERIAVQEGEKRALRAAGGAGEAGEAAEETRDAPRETGEVTPKPKDKEGEQDENEWAAVGHDKKRRSGREGKVLFHFVCLVRS